MRLLILADGFVMWGGGIDFLRFLIKAIQATEKITPDSIHIACGASQDFLPLPLKLARSAIRLVARPFDSLSKKEPDVQWARAKLANNFSDLIAQSRQHTYSGQDCDLLHLVASTGPDVIIPSFRPLPAKCRTPWVGYLYDFQHAYLPQFFTAKERLLRWLKFRTMLYSAKHVIVNSQSVAADCVRFFPKKRAVVHALPFTATCLGESAPEEDWPKLRDHYRLPPRFFIISNQLFVHKDHRTAIKAFALAFSEDPSIGLVCTGDTLDYRAQNLFSSLTTLASDLGLANRVAFLGRIPKAHQLLLMKHAISVVQPTLFEGGPGGGQVLEAVANGLRVIVSDITVNREMNAPGVHFFTAGDQYALAELFTSHAKTYHEPPPANRLQQNERESLRRLGAAIYMIASQASGREPHTLTP